jgi:hypothetical protein
MSAIAQAFRSQPSDAIVHKNVHALGLGGVTAVHVAASSTESTTKPRFIATLIQFNDAPIQSTLWTALSDRFGRELCAVRTVSRSADHRAIEVEFVGTDDSASLAVGSMFRLDSWIGVTQRASLLRSRKRVALFRVASLLDADGALVAGAIELCHVLKFKLGVALLLVGAVTHPALQLIDAVALADSTRCCSTATPPTSRSQTALLSTVTTRCPSVSLSRCRAGAT